MKEIELNNGLVIPIQGFGTFSYTDNLKDIIPIAVKNGHTLFDTSDDYRNEEQLGNALRYSFSKRSDYKIITKFTLPTHTYELESCLKKSLERLFGTADEPVDILLMHWPYPNIYLTIWKEMEKVYKKGLCRAIGVCNFNVHHLEKLLNYCDVIPTINQFEIHPLLSQKQLIDYCHSKNIQVMAYSPVARMDKRLIENKVLLSIAEKYKTSVVQVILRWDYQNSVIAIPAGSSEEHIRNNIDIFSFSLSDSDMELINGINEDYRVRFNPETFFSWKEKTKYLLANIYCKVK